MTTILPAELAYSIAMAMLLALTLPFNRHIARFAPARGRRQGSGGATNEPRRPILRCRSFDARSFDE
jgi:hypothetical protein